MKRFGPILCSIAAGALVLASWAVTARAQDAPSGIKPAHGIAMHGDLKYGPDFKHFDYVNPDAPKGGTVRLAGLSRPSTRSTRSPSKAHPAPAPTCRSTR